MILEELIQELNKLLMLSPDAHKWPVQILFAGSERAMFINEDVASISADEDVVVIVGESV